MNPSFPRAAAFLLTAVLVGIRPPGAFAAEVFQVTERTRAALPGGKEADGMIGDWVIRNDTVVAVIGDTTRRRDANQMVEGVQGAVIDFATRRENRDLLVVFYPMGYRPTGLSAGRAEIIQTEGETAILRVVRDATAEEPFVSTTEYALRDGEGFLRVRTWHENTSTAACAVPVADWLRMDNDCAGLQPQGQDLPVVLLENKWYQAAYGIAGLDGRTQRAIEDLDGRDKRNIGVLIHHPAINPRQDARVTLAPGGMIELARLLLVGRDAAAVQVAAGHILGHEPTLTRLIVREGDGVPVGDVFIDVTHDDQFVTAAISGADGAVELPLSDGTYQLTAAQVGRPAVSREVVVTGGVLKGEPELVLAARSEVTIDVAEAGSGLRMPVKIEFRGRNGQVAPYLGPAKRANGARNLFFSAHGAETIPVPPGDYTVHVSRGAEYDVFTQDIAVPQGGKVALFARLTRVIDSPGWIMADLHNHSTGSGDSDTEPTGRVLNLAGSGIEFAPATEHNRISSYAETIRVLSLERFITSAAGIELSGRPGPLAINHQIAFPVSIRPDRQGGGAPETDANPEVQMKRLLDHDPGSPKLMQQNHPDIGWLYHDRDRDGIVDRGFATREMTDVIEIGEAMLEILRLPEPEDTWRTARAFHWLQLLNLGVRFPGTTNSDSHAVDHENGALFNWVRLRPDDPAAVDPWQVAEAVRAGRVVMSNGPFLDVSISGAGPGETWAAPAPDIAVDVKVQLANWAEIDRVQVLVNGRPVGDGNFTRESHPTLFGEGTDQFAHAIPLRLNEDAHIIVVAVGESATTGLIRGGDLGKVRPTAVSNPIFVDVDGGGFRANGDLLDRPLPTGKRGPAVRAR